ncbi:MAG: hypothetical protein ACE5I3_05070, partial [Phycisphaerae bacterium]
MSESSPHRRWRSRLGLLTGMYVAVLAAAIVAVPLWLGRVPEPTPLRPVHERGTPATAPEVSTIATRAAAPPADREPPASASQQPQPPETRPPAESPVVERQWSQEDAFSAAGG